MYKVILVISSIILIFFSTTFIHQTSAQSSNTITINFNSTVRQLSPLAFSMDVSGYGQGSYITNDTLHKQRLTALKLGMMRMHLAYKTVNDPNSAIVCHGSGCATSVNGDSWVTGIKSVGAEPVLITNMSGTHTVDQDKTDAVNLVKHFNNDTNNPVKRWILGNELDNSGNPDHMDATTYSNRFNAIYDAMKAVDPTIKIGGPATAFYDTSFIDTFLTISGSKVDFIDFHSYGQGGTESKTEATLLSETTKYTDRLTDLRNRIQSKVPSRVSQIETQVGEWNLDWNNDPKEYTHFTTVWSASVLGKIIQAGGYSMQFSDKNGGLGALYETNDPTHNTVKDDPMPIYHGYGMFTGEGLFPKFGTSLVSTTSSLNDVEVFASNNPKNIVAINKSASSSQSVSFNLTGISSGSIDVWRKDSTMNPIAAPSKIGTVSISNSSFSYTLTPYSVTTFVIQSGNTPTVSPTDTTSTKLQMSILLHGIGKGGDNVNPSSTGNTNPLHTQRSITISLFDSNNIQLPDKQGNVLFNNTSGSYSGIIDLGSMPSGVYTAKIKMLQYLNKSVPGIISISNSQTATLPSISLTTGDSNNDNTLSILDYNMILDCFSDLSPARNCSDQTKKQATDLTDDGNVNQFDYNLFLRELSVQSGQ